VCERERECVFRGVYVSNERRQDIAIVERIHNFRKERNFIFIGKI
jgi:hypothetical protein